MSEKYGVKISKAGEEVVSCGYNDLIFTSELPLLKIHKQGSGSLTTNEEGTAWVAIPHTTGIVPMFIAFTEWYDSGILQTGYRQFSFSFYTIGGDQEVFKAWTTATDLNISYSLFEGGDITLKYLYFIFEDPILDV